MANKRKLTIEIFGDAKDATRAFGKVETAGESMSTKLGRVGKTAALAVGGIAIAGVGAAAVLGPKVLEMGGKLEVIGIKSATVFESSRGDVERWAAANAKSMGLTKKEAEGMAASMGDLLKPMGFTAKQAADMSIDMNDLSGALSAWSGGKKSATEVSEILSKAMLGERDGLKALGISLSEAEVKARLLEKGQDKLTGKALAQAKAIASQELIMEKSTDAQKAWADGSMDAMKAQMASEASIKQVKESLVQALYPALQAALPYIEKLATWMGENLPVAMDAVKAWVDEHWPEIRDTIIPILVKIRDGIQGFIEFVQDAWAKWGDEITLVIENVWPPIYEKIKAVMEIIQGVIKTVTALITGDWSGAWDGIKQIVHGIWESIKADVQLAIAALKTIVKLGWEGIKEAVKGIITGIWNFIKGIFTETIPYWVGLGIDKIVAIITGLPGSIKSAVSGAFDSLWDSFSGVINRIIDGWNNLSFTLPKINTHIPGVGTIGGWTVNTPNLPRLHQGGEVGGISFAGLTPDEVATVLRRGETVITPEQRHAVAGSGNTYVLEYKGVVPPDAAVMRQFRMMVESVEREKAGAL